MRNNTYRYYSGFFILLLFLSLLPVGLAQSRIVEKLLARVNNELITLTDLRAFMIIHPELKQELSQDEILDKIIENRLLVYNATTVVSVNDIQEKEVELISMYGGEENYIRELLALDIDREIVSAELLRVIAAEQLINERVSPFVFVSPGEVEEYFNSHVDSFDGLSLEETRDDISRLLTKEKLSESTEKLVKRFRNKAGIEIIGKD